MKKIKITDLRKYLKGLSQKELENEIVTLVKNYTNVNEYFAVQVDSENLERLIEESKEKIENEFFPSRGFGKFNFRTIRKIISEMKKLTNDKKIIIDLGLHAVELGIDFTNEYGDISEKFYDSILNLFYDSLEIIRKEGLHEEFKEECKKIYNKCPDIGWGFTDEINELYYNYFSDFIVDDEEV